MKAEVNFMLFPFLSSTDEFSSSCLFSTFKNLITLKNKVGKKNFLIPI